MFEQLFQRPEAIARHASAPYARERARYLSFCLASGYSRLTVRHKAFDLLWIARTFKRAYADLHLTKEQVRIVGRDWRARSRTLGRKAGTPHSRQCCVLVACAWLRYLGCLKRTPIPFQRQLDAWCEWAHEERGLSAATIASTCAYLKYFLCWYATFARPLSAMRIGDIEAYLRYVSERCGWSRLSIHNSCRSLRTFFRYGATQGWSPPRLAQNIRGPCLYESEGLPRGPSWTQVERLIANLDRRRPRDVRDRAILMLLAIYGLRSGEVVGLRLEDLDWEGDQLHVWRPKRRTRQSYPLLPSVGDAILEYLRTVRPASTDRTLFLSFTSPHGPLSRCALYDVVASRLKRLGMQSGSRGPHCLRHACATHLLAQGFSMKEIGDHLGHRSARATRIYAKVDLPHLRRVAAFDLGALS
jgi:integrase/recombinase XerD